MMILVALAFLAATSVGPYARSLDACGTACPMSAPCCEGGGGCPCSPGECGVEPSPGEDGVALSAPGPARADASSAHFAAADSPARSAGQTADPRSQIRDPVPRDGRSLYLLKKTLLV